ncbi:hypothetical protein, partial [Saliniramus sp.]|uniref:hypothetical protein n=1 Tax=Saliniramus sp. TaxID=2986772 RepID=UPI002C73154B
MLRSLNSRKTFSILPNARALVVEGVDGKENRDGHAGKRGNEQDPDQAASERKTAYEIAKPIAQSNLLTRRANAHATAPPDKTCPQLHSAPALIGNAKRGKEFPGWSHAQVISPAHVLLRLNLCVCTRPCSRDQLA